MTRRVSESGFTLIEILVASMLLAMLITILTMVFNSSSIAWSTGKANVAEMDDVRMRMSAASIAADNAVPGVEANNRNTWGYLVGPWDSKGNIRKRAIVGNMNQVVGGTVLTLPTFGSGAGTWMYNKEQLWATLNPGNVQISGNAKAYSVGVWSLGPDGKENSGDDISTWPDAD